MFTKRSLFFIFSYVFEEIRFSFKVAHEQALHLRQSREVTREQHAKDDASTCGGWLASLALNGELASRLYDQGIIFTSFLK